MDLIMLAIAALFGLLTWGLLMVCLNLMHTESEHRS